MSEGAGMRMLRSVSEGLVVESVPLNASLPHRASHVLAHASQIPHSS